MKNDASFAGKQLTNVHGRKSELLWRPNNGFDRFDVTLVSLVWSADVLDSFGFDGPAANRVTDTLTVSEGDLTTCSYPEIDLSAIETQITQRRKLRRVQFHYDSQTINRRGFAGPTFGFHPQPPLAGGPLRDSYMIRIDGQPERPLAVELVTTDVASTALRVALVRTGPDNSPMRKLAEMHSAWNAARALFAGFTIGFSKGDLDVNPTTVEQIEVIELAGCFLTDRMPPLSAYTVSGADHGPQLAGGPSGVELLDDHRHQRRPVLEFGETVEVLTVVFKPGHYRGICLD